MTKLNTKSDRMKLLLIPVLGLVLLFVLMDGEDPADTTEPQTDSDAELAAAKARILAKAEKPATDRHRTTWPRRDLAAIVAHNPFDLLDPRVQLDRDFAAIGITKPPVMDEISADDFFPEPDQTDVATEDVDSALEYLYELAAMAEAETNEDTLAQPDAVTSGETDATPFDSQSAVSDETPAVNERFARLQSRLTQLQNEPVTMVLKTRRGKSALLGPRRIAEGEIIEDGVRVASIRKDGVTFEIVANDKTQEAAQEQ